MKLTPPSTASWLIALIVGGLGLLIHLMVNRVVHPHDLTVDVHGVGQEERLAEDPGDGLTMLARACP